MGQGNIHVIALAQASEQTATEVKAALTELVQAARREPGCIRYELYCDSAYPLRLNTIEVWKDAEAFEAHMRADHTARAISALEGKLAADPEIRILSQIA